MLRARLTAGRRPRPEATATTAAFDDHLVIYCERTQRMHCLDPAASLVWALCDGSREVTAIVMDVAGIVGVDPAVVRADVEATVGHFCDLGVLR